MHHIHMIQYEHNTYIMYIYTVEIDVITSDLGGYSPTLVGVPVNRRIENISKATSAFR